jgi:hypothetical protein
MITSFCFVLHNLCITSYDLMWSINLFSAIFYVLKMMARVGLVMVNIVKQTRFFLAQLGWAICSGHKISLVGWAGICNKPLSGSPYSYARYSSSQRQPSLWTPAATCHISETKQLQAAFMGCPRSLSACQVRSLLHDITVPTTRRSLNSEWNFTVGCLASSLVRWLVVPMKNTICH